MRHQFGLQETSNIPKPLAECSIDSKEIYAKVQEHYGLAAKGANHEYGYTVAKAFGYTGEELANTPQGANLGLSCGNPLVLAKLKEV